MSFGEPYQLRHLVALHLTGIGHCGADLIQHVVQLWVSTWSATGRDLRLRRAVLGSGGDETWEAVGWVVGGCFKIGRVNVGVDVEWDASEVGWEQVIGTAVGDRSKGRGGRGQATVGCVRPRIPLYDLEIRVLESCVTESEAELVDWLDVPNVE